jgi:hypothetical protein
VACLVARADMDAFGAAVAELDREFDGRVQLRFIGPLPPYSFVDATPELAAWA